MSSQAELLAFTRHESPVIQGYAMEALIQSEAVDVVDLFAYVLKNNKQVQTFEGCIMDQEWLSSIVYHYYWNKIRIDARNQARDKGESGEYAIEMAPSKDAVMLQLDELLINTDEEVWWLLYSRAFDNRIYEEDILSRIAELSFKKNNGYAFNYLYENHQEQFQERINKYFYEDFPKAQFSTDNDRLYFNKYVDIMLGKNDPELLQIVVNKLNSDDLWSLLFGKHRLSLKPYKE